MKWSNLYQKFQIRNAKLGELFFLVTLKNLRLENGQTSATSFLPSYTKNQLFFWLLWKNLRQKLSMLNLNSKSFFIPFCNSVLNSLQKRNSLQFEIVKFKLLKEWIFNFKYGTMELLNPNSMLIFSSDEVQKNIRFF